jgi:2-dehydro-3-deoxygalactonokinase
MRGEETQLLGALRMAPQLSARATLLMPGSHSKWVEVRDGRIDTFTTYLSGELFAVLRDHSILGRPQREAADREAPASGAGDDSPEAWQAFDLGVSAVRRQGSASALLFSTRALVLSGEMKAGHSLQYLSGLLIGDELCCAWSARQDSAAPLALIGDDALCARYRRALSAWGCAEPLQLSNTAACGLWHLAAQAGLLHDD